MDFIRMIDNIGNAIDVQIIDCPKEVTIKA